MLALGAVSASGFNFYSFVFLPSFVGVGNLEGFVRDNYLGGLYLFGIGSSIAPFCVYVFNFGKNLALLRYLVLSLAGLILIGVGGVRLANIPWSYVCLAAAFCMHVAGFFLAELIRQERILAATVLQVVQPMLFAGLLTLHEFGLLSSMRWSYLYSLSCFLFIIAATAVVDWKCLIGSLNEASTKSTSWSSILSRIALSASFPLFFQLELVLAGNSGSINLGEYAMTQKLYASIAIALFGSIGLRMAMDKTDVLEDGEKIIDKRVTLVAFLVFCSVLLVGVGLIYFGKWNGISIGLLIVSAIIAFLYTISSFLMLLLNSFRPYLAFKTFSFSLLVYAMAYYFISPKKSIELLALAGLLFFTHIVSCYLMIFVNRKRSILS